MKLVTQIRVIQEGFISSRYRLLALSPGDTLQVQYHGKDMGCDISAEEARRMVSCGAAEATEFQPLIGDQLLTILDSESEEVSYV